LKHKKGYGFCDKGNSQRLTILKVTRMPYRNNPFFFSFTSQAVQQKALTIANNNIATGAQPEI